MRRKDRALSTEAALQIIDACPFATLSLIDEEGMPYGVPITIVREGSAVYFHSALEGRKIDGLRKNSHVSLSCVEKAENSQTDYTVYYTSAILKGRAEEITEEEEKLYALELLCRRHTPQLMKTFSSYAQRFLNVTGVWKITVESVSGKGNSKPE